MDERKQRILQAIIDDYISSAEPVGSRTIARKYDLGVSPATIRNEMADLEMLGYLEQIHTSSGRIPSSLGYRFYVNGLKEPPPVTPAPSPGIGASASFRVGSAGWSGTGSLPGRRRAPRHAKARFASSSIESPVLAEAWWQAFRCRRQSK